MNLFMLLPTLKTKRLRLRQANMGDAADLFEYSKDPKVAQHVLCEAHRNINETKRYIRYLIKQYRGGYPSTFVIEYVEKNKVIGTIGFSWVEDVNKAAEIGYSLNREYWNKGIMTEALKAVLEYAFTELNLNRVEAQHELSNPSSGRVLEKVGMKYEGCMRQRIYNKGKYVDVAVYAILREDERVH